MFTLSLFMFYIIKFFYVVRKILYPPEMEHLRLVPFRTQISVFFLYLFLKTFIFQIYQNYRTLLTYHSFLPQRRNNFSVLLFVAFGSVYYLYLVFFFPVRHVVFFPGAGTPLSGPLWCPNLNLFSFIYPNNFFLELKIISGNRIFLTLIFFDKEI